jgi:phosphate uptake regulator, PhoU
MKFFEELEETKKELIKMASMVQTAIEKAMKSLLDQNVD